jgi:beta-glucosidase
MRERKWAQEKAHELVQKMSKEEVASQLVYHAPQIERLGIPEYHWWNEGLHGIARDGVATVFPQAIAMAAMFDDDAMEKIGDAIGQEGRAKYNEAIAYGDRDIYKGLTFWAPNINIFRDPRWGRGQETYGEDPYLTSRLGIKFVEGLQGKKKYLKVAACAKHFAVHSGPEKLRHGFQAIVGEKDLNETYLPSFQALVEKAHVEAVMGAYNRTNGEPCCANKSLMKKLRDDWGFCGHFVSDCGAIKDFHQHHHVTKSPEESAALALTCGCDLNCGGSSQEILSALHTGLIREEDMRRAAEHLFTTRYLLGMFDKTEFDSIGLEVIESKEHIQLALDAARKGTVLLKNDGILPLHQEKIHTIGVIGPLANSRTALIGNYYGKSSRYITVLEGIQDACEPDTQVLYSLGCPLVEKKIEFLVKDEDGFCEALSVVRRSDVVVLCVGLDESVEGEETNAHNVPQIGDKPNLKLPGLQEKLLEKIIDGGKPVIVVVMGGSSLDLSYAKKKAQAILLPWYPGARGGRAFASMLFGKTAPSGKLPITFYKDSDALPPFTDYSMKGRTYRYVDEDNVLYPFGYGLTYGRVEVVEACIKNKLEVFATVQNFATIEVEEVLQVYVRPDETRYAVDHMSLCQFKRIVLKQGERKEVKLRIDPAALCTYDENGVAKVRGHAFTLSVGLSQNDRESLALMQSSPCLIHFSL